MPGYDDIEDNMPPDQGMPPAGGGKHDVVRDFTNGVVGTKEAATGVKLVSGFVPGGTLLDLGATAAIANEESEDSKRTWEEWAQKLGCSVDFLVANSTSLRCLAKEETDDHMTNTLSDWSGTTIGGLVGGALGWAVPIPGASLILGFAGSQVGGSFHTQQVHSEINVRDIANEIERKQYYNEEVTPDEAFLLALSPQDRQAVYEKMKAQIPEGTDPVTAKYAFQGIALDSSYMIADKVSSLGIDVEPGEFPAVALANAMNNRSPANGKKLHPVLVLLDNPDNVPLVGQNQNMGNPAQGSMLSNAGFEQVTRGQPPRMAPATMDDVSGEATNNRLPKPAGGLNRNPRDGVTRR